MTKLFFSFLLIMAGSSVFAQTHAVSISEQSANYKLFPFINSSGDTIQVLFMIQDEIIEFEFENNSDSSKGVFTRVDTKSGALQSFEMKNGTLSEYYSSGLIKWNYGCENDTCYETHYHKSGEISQRFIFLKPESDSLFPSGEDYLLQEMRYQNGVTRFRDTLFSSNGNERKIYDPSGHLRLVVMNGPSNDWEGDFIEYYPNGGLRIKGSFEERAGQFKRGEWLYYTPGGNLAMRQVYKNGRLISEEILIELSFEEAYVHLGY